MGNPKKAVEKTIADDNFPSTPHKPKRNADEDHTASPSSALVGRTQMPGRGGTGGINAVGDRPERRPLRKEIGPGRGGELRTHLPAHSWGGPTRQTQLDPSERPVLPGSSPQPVVDNHGPRMGNWKILPLPQLLGIVKRITPPHTSGARRRRMRRNTRSWPSP